MSPGIFARPPQFLAEFLPAAFGGGLKVGFRIFVKKGSDFVQKVPRPLQEGGGQSLARTRPELDN